LTGTSFGSQGDRGCGNGRQLMSTGRRARHRVTGWNRNRLEQRRGRAHGWQICACGGTTKAAIFAQTTGILTPSRNGTRGSIIGRVRGGAARRRSTWKSLWPGGWSASGLLRRRRFLRGEGFWCRST